GFLIFIHEAGHFLVARKCKVKVKQFAIGFGPAMWQKQGKETLYVIRLIPLGGFVSMEGEDSHSDEEGSFSKASIPKKIIITIAGGLVNIIFGLIAFFILSSIYLGNIVDGFKNTIEFFLLAVEGIKQLFTWQINLNQLTGPIGISTMVAQTNGVFDFVYLLAVVSISLGITNLLPIPPLDGGKVLIYIIEAIRRKPFKENTEYTIQMLGFTAMIALSIFVAYNDIIKIR
ncbi:MAG: site-2 protease family protein, partial [Clostridia bacterium]|nr:site-2 protease family protein [Clostridia bacterium]